MSYKHSFIEDNPYLVYTDETDVKYEPESESESESEPESESESEPGD